MKLGLRISLIVTSLFLVTSTSSFSQRNQWQPDSTAYEYLTRGGNVKAFSSDRLSEIAFDFTQGLNNANSIKWTIPANTGSCNLFLNTVDLDLRNKVVYFVCKKNHNFSRLTAYANTASGKQFKICAILKESSNGLNLPATEWHQTGGYLAGMLNNSADISDLEHITSIVINAPNCSEETILWIDEIKTITPRGPACAISFNRYRDQADTLLTPYLLQNNIKANIDFNYEFASSQTIETYTAVPFQSIGLARIDTLVNQHGWSCSSHGTFYDRMPYLSQQKRYELFSLDSFINKGFDARWCLSIPKDNANENIYKEINDYGQFRSIRKQGQDINTLPISNPLDFGFFRPTSAAAGPNIGGFPLLLSEMKLYVDSCVKNKGLIVLDFGTIVANPSTIYTDVETTLLSDAIALIEYVDSLGIPFVTFKDIFEDNSAYIPSLTASNDYYQLTNVSTQTIPVLANDMIPSGTSITVSIINNPTNGTILLNGNTVQYTPNTSCFIDDQFTYIISDGLRQDTAVCYLKRMTIVLTGEKTYFCNFNKYLVTAEITGGNAPYTYLWSNGSVTDTSTLIAATTHTVTITDALGCSISRSMFFPNRVASAPFVYNSIQCDGGVPTCNVSGFGTMIWYGDSLGTTLLQSGGNTFLSVINNTTTLYVSADYGVCESPLVPITISVAKPYADITFDSDTVVCNGDFIRLRANSEPNLNYKWKRNGVIIPGATNWRYITNVGGTFTLDVIRPDDQCIYTTDPVEALLIDTLIISYDDSLTFCAGDSIRLFTTYSPLVSYQWYRNGVPLVIDSSEIWVNDQASYSVEIIGSSSCNKTSQAVNTIINCTVNINEYSSSQLFSVYPSPANDFITIKSDVLKLSSETIRITDIAGRIFITEKLGSNNSDSYKINISTLPPGVYFITFESAATNRYTKFLKL